MRQEAAADYTPEFQVIRFKNSFQPFSDDQERPSFSTFHQMGFFIHEWIHFLHNVSTIHGIVAYSHALTIWSNVRNLMFDPVKLPADVFAQRSADVQRQNKHRLAARKAKNQQCPASLDLVDLTFCSSQVRFFDIDGERNYRCSEIVCDVEAVKGGRKFQMLIGNHEIVEFVAFQLEEKFLFHQKQFAIPVSVAPYHLVKGLASQIAPSLYGDTLIRCALLSLQDLDPPSYLYEVLTEAHKQSDPDEWVLQQARAKLREHEELLNETIDIVERMFSADEPTAHAVRYAIAKMRSNYKCRLVSPFFEVDLVEHLAKPGVLAAAVEVYGVGFLIQERSGKEHESGRDLWRDLSLADRLDPNLSRGRKMAHGAIDYIYGFFSEHSNELSHPATRCCPFYTCCDSSFRRLNGILCKTMPWVTKDMDFNNICVYGQAVMNTLGVNPKPIVINPGTN